MSHIDSLPPVVQLLLREPLLEKDFKNPTKYVRKMLPELQRQARWQMEHYDYYDDLEQPAAGFTIRPASGLDPFSRFGKCSAISCRVHNAQQVARTLGIYADTTVVSDPFLSYLLETEKWENSDTEWLIDNLLVLYTLRPLFEAGIFKFGRGLFGFCQEHGPRFDEHIRNATEAMLADIAPKLQFTRKSDHIAVSTTDLYQTPLNFRLRLHAKQKRQLESKISVADVGLGLFKPRLRDEIRETILRINPKASPSSVTFSNSRVAILAARRFDIPRLSYNDAEVWEATRSANLPWLSNLTPPQILALRDEAKDALPRFRARMSKALTADEKRNAQEIVQELREEAEELRAELNAVDTVGESRFRNVAGILGLTASVYGFASEAVGMLPAVTGLMTLFGLLHTSDHKEAQEVKTLKSRPAYVLLKAQELNSHRDDQMAF